MYEYFQSSLFYGLPMGFKVLLIIPIIWRNFGNLKVIFVSCWDGTVQLRKLKSVVLSYNIICLLHVHVYVQKYVVHILNLPL
jgi:hypothetical protein